MVKQNQILILVFFVTTCGVPKTIQRAFNSVYVDTVIIASEIKMNGYYSILDTFIRPVYRGNIFNNEYTNVVDTSYRNTIFFSDGIFVTDFQNLAYRSDDNYKQVDSLITDIIINKKEATESFYTYWRWGVYRIEDGFLKMKWVDKPPKGNPYWYAYEIWYKILHSNSLKKTCYRQLYLEPKDTNFIYYKDETSETLAVFLKNENISKLTSANCWLKEYEWFWADKEAYKAYIKKLKEESKKK